MRVEILLPFVSAMMFITIRPAKEPREKIDWIVSLAHYRPQKRLSSAVMVNWSTFITWINTQDAVISLTGFPLLVSGVVV